MRVGCLSWKEAVNRPFVNDGTKNQKNRGFIWMTMDYSLGFEAKWMIALGLYTMQREVRFLSPPGDSSVAATRHHGSMPAGTISPIVN